MVEGYQMISKMNSLIEVSKEGNPVVPVLVYIS